MRVVTVPEDQWRQQAAEHADRVRNLLAPGMTGIDHQLNSGMRRQLRRSNAKDGSWTALDPENPVYNFLIEYYGLKGVMLLWRFRQGRWKTVVTTEELGYQRA